MAETYNVYWGTESGNLDLIESGLGDLEIAVPVEGILNYNTTYYWRVDATNEYGTTTGDEWSFVSIKYDPPLPTGVTLSDVEGEEGEPTGDPTGENNIITLKRLVAAAENAIWYEDI